MRYEWWVNLIDIGVFTESRAASCRWDNTLSLPSCALLFAGLPGLLPQHAVQIINDQIMAARVCQRDSAFAHFKIRLSQVLPQSKEATYELNSRRQVAVGVRRLTGMSWNFPHEKSTIIFISFFHLLICMPSRHGKSDRRNGSVPSFLTKKKSVCAHTHIQQQNKVFNKDHHAMHGRQPYTHPHRGIDFVRLRRRIWVAK